MRVDCHLTREQATLYQAVVDEMLEKAAHAAGIERSGHHPRRADEAQAGVQPPRAPAQGPLRRWRAARASSTRLEEILDEALAEGDKALCFTQFAEFGHMLRAHLQERLGREVLFLHGGTPKTARDEMVAALPGARTDRRCSCSR